MWPQSEPCVSETRQTAQNAIAECLSGGSTLRAWAAVWDLIQAPDVDDKAAVLETLRNYVARSADDDTNPSLHQAQQFQQAIAQSMLPHTLKPKLLQSQEVRHQYQQDQAAVHRTELQQLGIAEGEGLPMWMMYMTRRSKRSWKP